MSAVFLLCSLEPNVISFFGSSAANMSDSNDAEATLVDNLLAALLALSLR